MKLISIKINGINFPGLWIKWLRTLNVLTEACNKCNYFYSKHFNLRLKPLLTVILISTVFILDLSDYLDSQTIRMPLARNHNSIMQIRDERI